MILLSSQVRQGENYVKSRAKKDPGNIVASEEEEEEEEVVVVVVVYDHRYLSLLLELE